MTQNGTRKNEDQNTGWWAGAAVTGVAALAGALYWSASGSKKPKPSQAQEPQAQKLQVQKPQAQKSEAQKSQGQKPQDLKPRPKKTETQQSIVSSTMSGLASLLGSMSLTNSEPFYVSGEVARNCAPDNPSITNLNSLLADIYLRFIQLKNDDFQLHYKVFDKVFQHLHQKMKDVDPYYKKYSSTVQFAGSHYDNLRIKKPDEFDMDIVIGLPLNLSENSSNRDDSDIKIEPQAAGYIQLKMGVQFQKLPMRDKDEWQNNKAAWEWMDGAKYLCRSKFLDWFKSVVNKALNTFEKKGNVPIFYIEGLEYAIHKSESGPAMTLFIKNARTQFQLDVDLVPALKFPESRWPIGKQYRQIPAGCSRGTWMAVGKPDKSAASHTQERSWRIALHCQERGLMHNSQNLRQAVRLLKKLRDEQGMKKIASYYIKTLFFWEIVDDKNDDKFWRNSPAYLFKHMVGKLHAALVKGNIPYFWNNKNNLIGNVDNGILCQYAAKLVPLMQVLENPGGNNYKLVAKYLLSAKEYKEYNDKFLHI